VDLFFTTSKLAALFLIPGNLILLVFLLAGALLPIRQTRKWAARASVAAGALFTVLSLAPVGPLMLASLEQRFPPVDSCPRLLEGPLAGIILLGGGVGSSSFEGRIIDGVNDASDRLWLTASLARRFPHLPVVISGGQAFDNGIDRPEADATADMLEELGVSRYQMVLERTSRTTAENAAMSALSTGEGKWIVVTSAFHMPRAIGAFRQTGMSVIAAPTDFRITSLGSPLEFDATANLSTTNLAVREYLGLLGYWATGRSSDLMPGPLQACGN
jgi:uncharacterized SAM-binding protein YcdF (DUF218 family)